MDSNYRSTVCDGRAIQDAAAIAVFEVAGTAVALTRHQGGWPGPSSRIPR